MGFPVGLNPATDFIGSSHYLSILQCLKKNNAKMRRPTVSVTRWWAGRDNATLTEPTSSHANCSKTRRLPPVGCTLCWHAFDFKTRLLI